MALVLAKAAFAEDCRRAAVIVTPLFAPKGCRASLVIDRDRLKETGAVTLSAQDGKWHMLTARGQDEDRPWSAAPKRRWEAPAPGAEPEAAPVTDDVDASASPLD